MKVPCKTWNGQPALYAHLKLDGNYTRIETDMHGQLKITTSIGTDITRQLKGYDWLRPHLVRVPFGTIILGELHVPGKPCSDVKTAIKEHWDDLKFTAFAVESMDRTEPLEKVAHFCMTHGIDFAPFRKIMKGDTTERLMKDLPPGAEGWVLKDANLLNWYKLKPVLTIDLIVKSFTPGEGKYRGQVGAIIVETCEGYEVARVSGFADAVRASMSSDREGFVGRVLEVAYQEVGSKGRLRHPRFIRWRDDKAPEGCTADQDPELERIWHDLIP